LEEFLHLSELRENENFDNPLVLSFLSKFSFPNCFVPDKFLFKTEMDRIKFSASGRTAADLPAKSTKFLIMSYIINKIFVGKLLLKAEEFYKGQRMVFSKLAKDNLMVLSGCFYYMF
jgi:hypothetical protein